MCGIFGIALTAGASVTSATFKSLMRDLYRYSESRGRESAGLHIYLPVEGIAWTLKVASSASELLRSKDFNKVMEDALGRSHDVNSGRSKQPIIAIAHSRLVTNGSSRRPENNQPVRSGRVVVVHNGIVVNHELLWKELLPQVVRKTGVDSEVVAGLLSDAMEKDASPILAMQRVYEKIKGTASVAWVHDGTCALTLGTNTGDIYYKILESDEGVIFASEKYILGSVLRNQNLSDDENSGFRHLSPSEGLYFDATGEYGPKRVNFAAPNHQVHLRSSFPIKKNISQIDLEIGSSLGPALNLPTLDESLLIYDEERARSVRRCSVCVLPETFPYISFDESGVCNYCHGYTPHYKGVSAEAAKQRLLEELEKYRSKDGSPDVLMPFSGGRDSCYGLHIIKREFGLNPITFTYDWGMVTDLARRNIARFCGELGVQNILVSADLKMKRDNIHRNVSAWLKRPDLGMVPLFMAGDKHFFSIINKLKKQTGIKLNVWSSNPLENTDFKSGLCGVPPDFKKKRFDYLTLGRNARMVAHYGKEFVMNPGYFNRSVIDTASAFLAYYFEKRSDYFWIFQTVPWIEKEVNSIIQDDYDFEVSPDSRSTWRIGDGTAAFYNYIYMTALGFTEFDTFRSNQIREGMLDREEALRLVLEENRPRVDSLRWYFDTISLDGNAAIRRINLMSR